MALNVALKTNISNFAMKVGRQSYYDFRLRFKSRAFQITLST